MNANARIPTPPPADILAEELARDPLSACEWILGLWAGAAALADEVAELRGYVADLQGEVGI